MKKSIVFGFALGLSLAAVAQAAVDPVHLYRLSANGMLEQRDGEGSPDGNLTRTANAQAQAAIANLSAITPSTVLAAGGDTITVSGNNFEQGATVLIDGVSVSTTYLSASALSFTAPAAAGGVLMAIAVQNPNAAASSSVALSYDNPVPVLASVSPTSVPANAGQLITVSGANFVADSTVLLGGAGMPTNYINASTLEFSTSDQVAGVPASVVVSSPYAASPSGALNLAFTTACDYWVDKTGSAFWSSSDATWDGSSWIPVNGRGLNLQATGTWAAAYHPQQVRATVSYLSGSDSWLFFTLEVGMSMVWDSATPVAAGGVYPVAVTPNWSSGDMDGNSISVGSSDPSSTIRLDKFEFYEACTP